MYMIETSDDDVIRHVYSTKARAMTAAEVLARDILADEPDEQYMLNALEDGFEVIDPIYDPGSSIIAYYVVKCEFN